MKKDITSLDLFFLLKELQILSGAKLDKVFQKGKDFLFQLHVPSIGKKYLRVLLPGILYLTETKDIGEVTDNFALALRKHVSNSRIKNIVQKEFERIVEIELENNKKIYIELFSPGNIILCDLDEKIIMAVTYKGFGSRIIRPSVLYSYPKKDYDFLQINESELRKLLESSEKSSVVITLATDLGLGGSYAEEICCRSNIDGKKTSLEDKEIKRLHDVIQEIKKTIPNGFFYKTDNSIEITPFKLSSSKMKFVEEESFNSTIEKNINLLCISKPTENKHLKEKEKLESIIKNQELRIEGLLKSADESQKKGELIYLNYELIGHLIKELLKAKEKIPFKDIKEKLKGHKYVKDINEKEKKIILEI
ncbi:MAG: NFACT family protein [Nanoarchaeota archaeon]